MTPVQKTARDALVKEAKRIAVAIEELVDGIEEIAAEDATFFTSFDVKRTTLDLRVAARLTIDVSGKLEQVGTWNEKKKK